jgi:YVTN family beta-propeller protein
MMIGFDVGLAFLALALVGVNALGSLFAVVALIMAGMARRAGRSGLARAGRWLASVGLLLGFGSLAALLAVVGHRWLLSGWGAAQALALVVGVVAALLARRTTAHLSLPGVSAAARARWSERRGRRRALALAGGGVVYGAVALGLWILPLSRAIPEVRSPSPPIRALLYADASRVADVGQGVYLAHRADGLVSVVHAARRAVVATLPVEAPDALTVSPDGARLYVAGAQGIVVVDTATLRVVDALRSTASALAVSPDGARLYAVRESGGSDATLTVIDLARGTVGPAMPIRGLVSGIVVSPDGLRLYVAHRFYSGLVSVVDVVANRVVDEWRLEDGATALAVTRDGARLLVPNGGSGSGRLTVLDPTTGTQRAQIPLTGGDPAGVAVAVDGRQAFVSSFQAQSVAVIDAAEGRLARTVAVSSYPTQLVTGWDGASVWVAHNDADTVSAIDTASLAVSMLGVGARVTRIAAVPTPPDYAAVERIRAAYAALSSATRRLRTLCALGFVVALAVGVASGLWRRQGSFVLAVAMALLGGLAWGALALYVRTTAAVDVGRVYGEHRWPLEPWWTVLAVLSGVATVLLVATSLRAFDRRGARL